MGIELTCPFCRTHVEADDTRAGRAVACPNCGKVCMVPDVRPPVSTGEKLHLAVPHQEQAIEDLSEARKHCPRCRAEAADGAVICIQCGYNFLTRSTPFARKRRERERFHRGFLGWAAYLGFWLVPLALLTVAGYGAFLWIDGRRASKDAALALQTGDLDRAAVDYRRLALWCHPFEFVGWRNRSALRAAQLDADRGKSYLEAKDSQLPLVVDASVWGSRRSTEPVAWVRYRLVNYYDQPVLVHPRFFVLVGVHNNVAFADTSQWAGTAVKLRKDEGIQGALCFDGMITPPAFLAYDNGRLLSWTPIYANASMDAFAHDDRFHPSAGKSADQFPLGRPAAVQRLTADEVKKTWNDYVDLREPPAAPDSVDSPVASPSRSAAHP